MRKYAFLKEEGSNICKVMIFATIDETNVFLYDTIEDTACFADCCFESIEEAEQYCKELGVNNKDWCYIDDPLEGCQDDTIKCK